MKNRKPNKKIAAKEAEADKQDAMCRLSRVLPTKIKSSKLLLSLARISKRKSLSRKNLSRRRSRGLPLKTLEPPSSLHKLKPTKWRAFIIKPAELPQLPTVQLIDSYLSRDSSGVPLRLRLEVSIVERKMSGQLELMAGVPVAMAAQVVFVTQPQEFIMRTVVIEF